MVDYKVHNGGIIGENKWNMLTRTGKTIIWRLKGSGPKRNEGPIFKWNI